MVKLVPLHLPWKWLIVCVCHFEISAFTLKLMPLKFMRSLICRQNAQPLQVSRIMNLYDILLNAYFPCRVLCRWNQDFTFVNSWNFFGYLQITPIDKTKVSWWKTLLKYGLRFSFQIQYHPSPLGSILFKSWLIDLGLKV